MHLRKLLNFFDVWVKDLLDLEETGLPDLEETDVLDLEATVNRSAGFGDDKYAEL